MPLPLSRIIPFRERLRWPTKGLCAGLACLVLLAGCEPPAPTPPMRMAVNKWPGYEPLFIGESLGYFAANTVHLVETPISAGLVQALRGATIDGAAMSLTRTLKMVEEGLDLTIVMVFDSSNGADVLLARPDITGVTDLNGKVVGAETDTVNGYLLMRALEENGVSPSALTIIHDNNENLPRRFLAGEIDALSTFGRPEEEARAAGAHAIFSSRDIPGEVIDVLAVRTSYLRANQAKVEALLEGWIKIRRQIGGLNPETLSKLPEGAMKNAQFIDQLNRVRLFEVEENLTLLADDGARLRDLMQRRRTVAVRLGLSNSDGPLPAVDPAPFEAALRRANTMARP